jgi:putative endonuclease
MPYCVYILYSEGTSKYYCGQTDDIAVRLIRHNNKEVKSTKHGSPWLLVGYIVFDTRAEAMRMEMIIKKRGIERWLNQNAEKLIR